MSAEVERQYFVKSEAWRALAEGVDDRQGDLHSDVEVGRERRG